MIKSDCRDFLSMSKPRSTYLIMKVPWRFALPQEPQEPQESQESPSFPLRNCNIDYVHKAILVVMHPSLIIEVALAADLNSLIDYSPF